jgi:murein L,D-transpeptidase YcbB/YkuD
MQAAIIRYTQIVARGGLALASRFASAGGLGGSRRPTSQGTFAADRGPQEQGSNPERFDDLLMRVVRRYQAANLAPTGIIDKRTIGPLNVPAAARLIKLEADLGACSRSPGRRRKRM